MVAGRAGEVIDLAEAALKRGETILVLAYGGSQLDELAEHFRLALGMESSPDVHYAHEMGRGQGGRRQVFGGSSGIRPAKGTIMKADALVVIRQCEELPEDIWEKFVEITKDGRFTHPDDSKRECLAKARLVLAFGMSKPRSREKIDKLRELHKIHVLRIPPLCDRKQDAPAFLYYCFSRSISDRTMLLSQRALLSLSDYSWPGNVQQMSRAVLELCRMDTRKIRAMDVDAVLDQAREESAIERLLERSFISVGPVGLTREKRPIRKVGGTLMNAARAHGPHLLWAALLALVVWVASQLPNSQFREAIVQFLKSL